MEAQQLRQLSLNWLQTAGTADSFEKLIQETFQWTNEEASSKMEVLFPAGLDAQGSSTTPCPGDPTPLAAAVAASPPPPPAASAAAAFINVKRKQQQPQTASPFSLAAPALSPLAVPATPPQGAAGPNLVSPFSGLTADLLLAPAAAAAGPLAGADAGLQAAAAGPVPAAVPGDVSGARYGLNSPAAAAYAAAVADIANPQQQQQLQQPQQLRVLHQQFVMQQAQQELMLRQAQQQQQQQVITTQLQQAPLQLQPQQQLQQQQQQQVKAPAARRRGRPPKADGQYSQAYLALKSYRARKRNELEDMEAEIAAKLAQLAALQEENKALKHKHEALEETLGIQERMVAQLSALQLAEQTAADGAGSSSAAAAAAALPGGGGRSTDVSAIVAAVTGEPDQLVTDCQACQDSSGLSGPGSSCGRIDPNNPDWANIVTTIKKKPGVSGPMQAEQLNVPQLLERYKGYVAAAASALGQLAAALQQQHPQQFPPGAAVPPSAIGTVLPEQALALGVLLPRAPFRLGEFLALGNDERIPPALPAINLLTGKHESIEPEIWRVVASQISLRPRQAEKLAAAWSLYSASLDAVNEERSSLMTRLKHALDTCHRSSAAADAAGVGLSEGGVRLGVELTSPNDAAVILSDERLLDDVLNQHEYYDLSEAIDANMAREDGIMILFDYAITMMLDEVQLCQVVVSSWPFFPLMGSVAAWLVDAGGLLQGA